MLTQLSLQRIEISTINDLLTGAGGLVRKPSPRGSGRGEGGAPAMD
jgi:hypothetical protein